MNHYNDLGKTLFTIISQIDLTYYIHIGVNDVTFFKNCTTLIRLNEFNLVLKIHSYKLKKYNYERERKITYSF
jgi:hypothetical protein